MNVEEIQGNMGSGIGNYDNFPIGMIVFAVDDDPLCLKLLETLLRKCYYHGGRRGRRHSKTTTIHLAFFLCGRVVSGDEGIKELQGEEYLASQLPPNHRNKELDLGD